MKPLVSVSITAYNHQDYIRQALDSVLRQKTTFSFEIVLGEDDSADHTRAICQEYAEKYPDKIRLLLNRRDQVIHIDGRPTGRWNLLNNLLHATGRYVAILDGDDYWTDPHKLQKQVDYLEAHPELSFCFTDIVLVDEAGQALPEEKLPPEMKRVLTREELIAGFYPCPPMGTLLLRRDCLDPVPDWFKTFKNGDIALTVWLSERGNAGYVEGKMTAYRQHAGGMWSARQQAYKARNTIRMREELIRLFAPVGLDHNLWLVNNNYLFLLKEAATKGKVALFLKESLTFSQHLLRHPKALRWLVRRLIGGKAPASGKA